MHGSDPTPEPKPRPRIPSRLAAALTLAALLAPTAWLARERATLRIDVENRSLKSAGTPEARANEDRIRSFGRDELVVTVFSPKASAGPAGAVDPSGFAPELDALAAEVRALSGVAEVRASDGATPGCAVWRIQLDVPDGACAPVVEELEKRLRAGTPSTHEVAIGGLPVGEVVIARELQDERARVLPVLAAAMVVLLLVQYRHAGLAAAILLPAGAGMVWLGGIAALLGRELDAVSVLLDPVLLTVGVASGVHWVEAYLDELARGREPSEAAAVSIRSLRLPAMLASLTTVIGFLSLSFNSIPAVVDFGVFASLGVALTYALATVATPALLVLAGARRRPSSGRGEISRFLGVELARRLARSAIGVRTGAAVLSIAAVAAWPLLKVDNDPLRVLPERHPFREDVARITAETGGAETFDVLVPASSRLADPIGLGLFAAQIAALDGVAGPAGPALTARGGERLLRFVLEPSGSAVRESTFAEVERRAAALGAREVRVAGTSVQIARDSGRLIRSTLWGTGSSSLCLVVVLALGFRSLRYALLAMVPNLLPCLLVYGGLAALGRPLSFATAMIGSVMLGLVVDDTVHFLHRFRSLRASGMPVDAALADVVEHSGRAIWITTVVLSLGFAAGLIGRLATTVEFAAVASATIGIAFLADIVLLPALLAAPRRSGRARATRIAAAATEAGHA